MRGVCLWIGCLFWLAAAGSSQAVFQLDLPAAVADEACLGALQAHLVCVGSPRRWPATSILPPSGHPAMWHIIFQYEEELGGKVVEKVELGLEKERRQWKPRKLESGYPGGPAFPVSGTVKPLPSCTPGKATNPLQVLPDPKARASQIRVLLQREGPLHLEILDLLGNSVNTLCRGDRNRGVHSFWFSGANLPAGLYLVKLEAEGRREIRKLLLP